MDIAPITATPTARQDQLMVKAEELEASFLSEMLAHSGLGEMQGSFGGGSGEEQFSSFLRQEQARLIVQHGGLGLAELIFNTMVEAGNAAA
jgi:Rod binding domain-containing protein